MQIPPDLTEDDILTMLTNELREIVEELRDKGLAQLPMMDRVYQIMPALDYAAEVSSIPTDHFQKIVAICLAYMIDPTEPEAAT